MAWWPETTSWEDGKNCNSHQLGFKKTIGNVTHSPILHNSLHSEVEVPALCLMLLPPWKEHSITCPWASSWQATCSTRSCTSVIVAWIYEGGLKGLLSVKGLSGLLSFLHLIHPCPHPHCILILSNPTSFHPLIISFPPLAHKVVHPKSIASWI